MIGEKATPLLVDIEKCVVSLMRSTGDDWRKAYLRFSSKDSVSEVKCSYEHGAKVDIINAVKNKDFFRSTIRNGQSLLAALGENEGVFLLTVDSDLKYEIEFEYDNIDRWNITKLDGRTGIPVGI